METESLKEATRLGLNLVVAIIGSSRFKDLILNVGKEFNLKGHTAIHSDVFTGADGYEISNEEMDIMVTNGHKRIDMADMVYVVNPEGYIGESTQEEIDYATKMGKIIKYYEQPRITLKIFVSIPMAGLSDDEVDLKFQYYFEYAVDVLKENRDKIIKRFACNSNQEEYDLEFVAIDSICGENRTPMGYIAYSIEKLDEADVFITVPDHKEFRGCSIEYEIATKYGTPVIIVADKYKYSIDIR